MVTSPPALREEWVQVGTPLPVEWAICKHHDHPRQRTVLGSLYKCSRLSIDAFPLEHEKLRAELLMRAYAMVTVAEKCGYSFVGDMAATGPFPFYDDGATKIWRPKLNGLNPDRAADQIVHDMGHRPDLAEYRLTARFLVRPGSKLPTRSVVRPTAGIPSPPEEGG